MSYWCTNNHTNEGLHIPRPCRSFKFELLTKIMLIYIESFSKYTNVINLNYDICLPKQVYIIIKEFNSRYCRKQALKFISTIFSPKEHFYQYSKFKRTLIIAYLAKSDN